MIVDEELAPAVKLVRARDARAQLCVLRHGRVVVDVAVNCAPNALFWIFSASKPLTALLVHLLAERGALRLDGPVAAHWPEFARHGKQSITVRQVLAHRAGLPVAQGLVRDALVITDWQRSIRHLERARPTYPPGEVPAYHMVSYGFLLGELVRRISGEPVERFLRDEFLTPLGLRDTYLGLPARRADRRSDELWERHVPIVGRGATERAVAVAANRRSFRAAVIPAAGISTTARDLARFYQALLLGGELDGVRVLRPETIEAARQPSSDGEIDRVIGLPIRWSYGFQLGGQSDERRSPNPMGLLSDRRTFGHNGSNLCLGWADPTRQLVMVYLTDRLAARHVNAPHQAAVSDAILTAFP